MMRALKYFLLGCSVIVVDQVTKYMALDFFWQPWIITRWFYCELMFNRGVSWGMFHSSSPFVFAALTGVIMLVVTVLAWFTYHCYQRNESVLGNVLVISGALSNIADRFVHHGVIDFLVAHCGSWVWPSFNIADAAIFVGTFIMIVCSMRR